jgi:dTDP-4-amino-4,6-dideoxygalactose transaminase
MPDLPAILGGTPVRPQGPPDWPGADAEVSAAVAAALADGSWGKYDGPHIERLEADLASLLGVRHVQTCASGTLAVELALRALQIAPGDEVVLAAYDYEANFLGVHAVGGTPVLVDIAPENWNLDPERLESAISPKTRAIIVSHLHGGMVPMREARDIADRAGVPVIEDAAQAVGATVQGRRAGAWGDIGVLSFGGSKLLSSGRGGALLTNRGDLHHRLRVVLRRGVQQWAALSELQAAALRPQVARLDERHTLRAAAVARLDELLDDVPGLRRFANACECSPAFYKVGYQLDAAAFGLDRERFCAAVRAEGIALDPSFRAAHVGRAPGRFRAAGSLAESERAHHGAVVLHHPVLLCNDDDLADVARAVKRAYANRERLRTPSA